MVTLVWGGGEGVLGEAPPPSWFLIILKPPTTTPRRRYWHPPSSSTTGHNLRCARGGAAALPVHEAADDLVHLRPREPDPGEGAVDRRAHHEAPRELLRRLLVLALRRRGGLAAGVLAVDVEVHVAPLPQHRVPVVRALLVVAVEEVAPEPEEAVGGPGQQHRVATGVAERGLGAVARGVGKEARERRRPRRRPRRRLGRRLEEVAEAVGGRLLSVTNAIEAGTWHQGDSGWA